MSMRGRKRRSVIPSGAGWARLLSIPRLTQAIINLLIFNGSSFCCAALAADPVVVRGVRANLVYRRQMKESRRIAGVRIEAQVRRWSFVINPDLLPTSV
jgi:hypothetical protein